MELRVNGQTHRVDTAAQRPLLSVLRDELNLTGSKYGCGEGECGACTVLIDGMAERSCIFSVGDAAGREITTIEGLSVNGKLHALQQAFIDHGAMQCGYCIPGMIMSAAELIRVNPDPSRAAIVRHMEGNVCRCGTYPRIEAAIRQAASMKGGDR